ncbi:hypothetical protein N0B31_14210 [Salinirubellus salinus]|uniref:Uncharacterized protein n=1 Tax=Salinirubellus salinus TaxID=1364945 RepID=A0A9E7R0A9_9EURY|nr:hypothetical protein [Salinirubellus salinus]UWM53291.1 hypothetical protein N0B31_14210 [Salinirubellus salinus]
MDETPEDGLPPEFESLVRTDTDRLVGLYNGLQGLDDEAFAAAFAGALDTLREVVDPDGGEAAAVLGLTLDGGTVADARVLSVTDEETVHHAAPGTDAPDVAVYLPVRPDDFPPGSGEAFADIDLEGFREVVAAMIYLRYQLAEEDPEGLASHHGEPLARGLRAYVDAA